jgi:hypothetical protein
MNRGRSMPSARQESRSSTRLPFAIRNLPGVVIRSLPPRSAMYPSRISRALCVAEMTAGGSSTDVLPTVRSEANSSRVSGADLEAITPVCQFPQLGVWSILLRPANKVASVDHLRQINAASPNLHKVRWYRAACRTDCSGYEVRSPRHTGPRSFPRLLLVLCGFLREFSKVSDIDHGDSGFARMVPPWPTYHGLKI